MSSSSYIWDQPVGGKPVFVGRAQLLRTLETGLSQGRSYALYGGPRSGRTSTLQQLVHASRARLARPQRTAKVVPVYIDLAGCPPGRVQGLVAHIWTAVRDTVLDPYVQAHPAPPTPGKQDPNRSPDPWPVLQQLLGDLWDGMANTPGWCRTLWLFDNAERLGPGAWKDADQVLAKIGEGDETWRPLACVWAGGPAWQQVAQRPQGPWTGLRSQTLTVLRDAEVAQLLRVDACDSAAMAPLITASGKHAMVLQLLLSALADAGGDTHAMMDIARPHLQSTFEAILSTFPAVVNSHRGDVPLEHVLMRLLIERDGDVNLTETEAALQRGPLKSACDLLEQNGVVERLVRGSSTMLRAGCTLWNSFYEAAV